MVDWLIYCNKVCESIRDTSLWQAAVVRNSSQTKTQTDQQLLCTRLLSSTVSPQIPQTCKIFFIPLSLAWKWTQQFGTADRPRRQRNVRKSSVVTRRPASNLRNVGTGDWSAVDISDGLLTAALPHGLLVTDAANFLCARTWIGLTSTHKLSLTTRIASTKLPNSDINSTSLDSVCSSFKKNYLIE